MQEQQTQNQTAEQAPVRTPFDSDSPIIGATQMPEQEKPEEKPEVNTESKPEVVVDEKQPNTDAGAAEDPLKVNLGFDSWDNAKKEIEELRKRPTAAAAPEIKYANEESEKLHKALLSGDRKEVVKILRQQEELEELSTGDLDTKAAAKVVKAAMKYAFDLTDAEVEHKFNKQFGFPSKPSRSEDETDEEYTEKVEAWQSAVKDAEMDLLIEAKSKRKELETYKKQIVIPDTFQKVETDTKTASPTQEELAAMKKMSDDTWASAQQSLKNFSGIAVTVQDKDVTIPLNYGLSEDEKTAVSKRLEHFSQNGLNANAILADLWVNEDGTVNTDAMTEDLSLLLNKKSIVQKIANEAANQRLELYLKEKKNININETKQSGNFAATSNKSAAEDVQDFFWNN
jgi:hypothetical protein